MAGSIKWMEYTTDNDVQYAVKIDESNGELAGFLDYTAASTSDQLPRGFDMRHVDCLDTVSGTRRSIYVGSIDDDIWTGTTTVLLLPLVNASQLITALTPFEIVRYVGEAYSVPAAFDTGLDDGDAT
ncbi:MAG TPA: hypothetical protein V6D26_30705 [Stenomitos sp.]